MSEKSSAALSSAHCRSPLLLFTDRCMSAGLACNSCNQPGWAIISPSAPAKVRARASESG